MQLIDTHCHLDVEEFDADRSQVLARARDRGVTRIVVPGIDAGGWAGLLELCQREPGMHPALGLHPVFLEQHASTDIDRLEHQLARHNPIAVGEIGLDYYVPGLDRDRQQALFEAQLRIARAADLPVLLHVRKAHDQVLAALRRTPVKGGIAHAFGGSPQQAERYIDMGFKLGFGGMLTFERSTKLRRLAAELPLEAIVLETDAPDLPGVLHRGERNSPEYLPECLQALADVRNEDPAFIARETTANALEVLALQ